MINSLSPYGIKLIIIIKIYLNNFISVQKKLFDFEVYMTTKELNQKKKIFNRIKQINLNFSFEPENNIFDICEHEKNIYIKIKINEFHPHRLIYSIVKENLINAKYIGVASESELILFNVPEWNLIKKFSIKISPELSLLPDEVPDLHKEDAYKLLNKIFYIKIYKNDIDIM